MNNAHMGIYIKRCKSINIILPNKCKIFQNIKKLKLYQCSVTTQIYSIKTSNINIKIATRSIEYHNKALFPCVRVRTLQWTTMGHHINVFYQNIKQILNLPIEIYKIIQFFGRPNPNNQLYRIKNEIRKYIKQDGAHEPDCKHVRKATYVQMTLL